MRRTLFVVAYPPTTRTTLRTSTIRSSSWCNQDATTSNITNTRRRTRRRNACSTIVEPTTRRHFSSAPFSGFSHNNDMTSSSSAFGRTSGGWSSKSSLSWRALGSTTTTTTTTSSEDQKDLTNTLDKDDTTTSSAVDSKETADASTTSTTITSTISSLDHKADKEITEEQPQPTMKESEETTISLQEQNDDSDNSDSNSDSDDELAIVEEVISFSREETHQDSLMNDMAATTLDTLPSVKDDDKSTTTAPTQARPQAYSNARTRSQIVFTPLSTTNTSTTNSNNNNQPTTTKKVAFPPTTLAPRARSQYYHIQGAQSPHPHPPQTPPVSSATPLTPRPRSKYYPVRLPQQSPRRFPRAANKHLNVQIVDHTKGPDYRPPRRVREASNNNYNYKDQPDATTTTAPRVPIALVRPQSHFPNRNNVTPLPDRVSGRPGETVADALQRVHHANLPASAWITVTNIPPMSSLEAMQLGLERALEQAAHEVPWVDLEAPCPHSNSSNGHSPEWPLLSSSSRSLHQIRQAHLRVSPFGRPNGWHIELANRSVAYALLQYAQTHPIFCHWKPVDLQTCKEPPTTTTTTSDKEYNLQTVTDATVRVEDAPPTVRRFDLYNMFSRFDLASPRQLEERGIGGKDAIVPWVPAHLPVDIDKPPPDTIYLVHFASAAWARAAVREKQGASMFNRHYLLRLAQYPRQIILGAPKDDDEEIEEEEEEERNGS